MNGIVLGMFNAILLGMVCRLFFPGSVCHVGVVCKLIDYSND